MTTYDEIAEHFGFKICPSEDGVLTCDAPFRDHDVGWASYLGIHWTRRQVRRHGLYRFLKLVVVMRMGLQAMKPGPEKLWYMSAGAYDLALDLGVRLPRKVLEADRTTVRSWLATGYGPDTDEDTRRRIARWAR